ncbi:MAG: Clp protease N-terminal domain-containing protein [Hyphomicrobium sp.]
MTKIIVDELGRIPMSPYLVATLSRAAAYADAQAHLQVTVEHLLLALAEDPEATVVLKSSDIDIGRLSADISAHLGRIEERQVEGGERQVMISPDLKRILEAAAAAASQSRRREINGAIVLAAVVGEGRSTAAHVLRAQGMTFEQAIKALKDVQTAPVRRVPASADEILADARERVQSRTQPPQREPAAAAVQRMPQPEPPSSGLAVPQDQVVGDAAQASGEPSRTERPVSVAASAARIPIEPTWESVRPVETREVAPAPALPPQPAPSRPDYGPRSELSASQEPSPYEAPTGAPQPMVPAPSFPPASAPAASQAPISAPQYQQPVAAAPPPAPAPMQPAPPSQWAPPAQQPTVGAASPRPPQRMPPPIPVVPSGPLPFPVAPSPPGGGPTLPMPYAPPPQQGYRPPAPPPWTDGQTPDPRAQVARPRGTAASDAMADPRARVDRPMQPQAPAQSPSQPFPPAQPQTQPPTRGGADARRRTVAPTIQAGQLVENIPRRMRIGLPVIVEARVARAEVKAIAEGMQAGGGIYRHEIMVSKAMTVRLRAPDGGFVVETASPETQWIDNVLGVMADDFASWRWAVTPRARGRRRLQLIVSARTVGGDGLMAETALPDQVIEVKVGINYARSAARWAGWAAAAIVGGVLARFGENAYVVARSFVDRMGG